MSRYTTSIQNIVLNYTIDNSDKSISQRINLALPKIFNFDYPLWSEDYRQTLERKIVLHYFNKEICYEVLGLWKIAIEERLNLIMPYYNEMYLTTKEKYDWLNDSDSVETYDANKEVTGKVKDTLVGNSEQNNNEHSMGQTTDEGMVNLDKTNKSLKSDLPQATFTGVDYGTNSQEDEGNEMSNTRSNTNSEVNNQSTNSTNINNENNTDTQSNSKDNFTRTRKGLTGARSRAQLTMEYRQSLINIDKQIIEELYDLFMLIY